MSRIQNVPITSHFNEIIQEKFSNFKHIYTDALKFSHRVGFVNIQEETTIKYILFPESSILSVENYVIYESIVSTNTITSNSILILSDPHSTFRPFQNS